MYETADSVEEWLKLMRRHKIAAQMMVHSPELTHLAWSNAGFACECLLKAAIMARERLNTWPSSSVRREVHTHDLEKLASILGMTIQPADVVAPAWSVVIRWKRHHMYAAGLMPAPVAQNLIEAVFGEEGVERWVCQNYLGSFI